MFGALALIACGTGLFKGNLQVMVGNLYDAPEYSSKRDTAFSIFYMAINIGAMYAPTAATKVTNYMLGKAGLSYVPQIPSLAHQYLDGTITPANQATLESLQAAQNFTGDIATFCTTYIDKLSEAYNYGFGVACVSLIISMLIYVAFRSTFKHADYNSKQAKPANVVEEKLTPEQTKQRIVALLLVFAVVIFFWMAFHQNGLTLTFFARDYTAQEVTGLDRLGFNIVNLTFLLIVIYGLFSLFQGKTGKSKMIAGIVVAAALLCLGWSYSSMDPTVNILPQIFQQFNPFFVIALTPVSLAVFGYLARKGKEPSARYDDCRMRFLDNGHWVYRVAYSGCSGSQWHRERRTGFSKLVDLYLSGAYFRRVVPLSDGYFVCFESSSSQIQRYDDGWMVCRNCHW